MNDDEFIYDGTIEGLFSIIYVCFSRRSLPKEIYIDENYQENLFDNVKYIETNLDNAAIIFNKINNAIPKNKIYKILLCFNSCCKDKDIVIAKYIIYSLIYGYSIETNCNLNFVLRIQQISKQVSREIHRMKGFIRFKKIKNIYVGMMSPDNNIIEFLSKHFSDRLSNERWMVCDTKRKTYIYYENGKCKIDTYKNLNFNNLRDNEESYEELWKQFCKSVNIKERKNLRQQRNYMPKKYWNYLIEMENTK